MLKTWRVTRSKDSYHVEKIWACDKSYINRVVTGDGLTFVTVQATKVATAFSLAIEILETPSDG